jgi:hypothetical protein
MYETMVCADENGSCKLHKAEYLQSAGECVSKETYSLFDSTVPQVNGEYSIYVAPTILSWKIPYFFSYHGVKK